MVIGEGLASSSGPDLVKGVDLADVEAAPAEVGPPGALQGLGVHGVDVWADADSVADTVDTKPHRAELGVELVEDLVDAVEGEAGRCGAGFDGDEPVQVVQQRPHLGELLTCFGSVSGCG